MTADASALISLAYPAPLPATDATYEVQARKTGGADDTVMGLVVRRTDEKNALYFVVANDGAFNILTKVNGSMQSLSGGWQTTQAIVAGGTNQLRVVATGGVYTFDVNGQALSHVTISDNGEPATFGFLAGGGRRASGDVTFTSYMVNAP